MSSIFVALRETQQQAESNGADGTAHSEWEDARKIDDLELAALVALIGNGLPVQQALRVMYEAGYSDAMQSLSEIR